MDFFFLFQAEKGEIIAEKKEEKRLAGMMDVR
jgi:hypothetical protein